MLVPCYRRSIRDLKHLTFRFIRADHTVIWLTLKLHKLRCIVQGPLSLAFYLLIFYTFLQPERICILWNKRHF